MALVLMVLPAAALAQSVEYELPTDFTIVPGRLVVNFEGTVTEQAAKNLIDTLDMTVEVVETNFPNLYLTAALDTPLSDDQRRRLEALPAVVQVKTGPEVMEDPSAVFPPDDPDSTRTRADAFRELLQHHGIDLFVGFTPSTTEGEATDLVQFIDGIRVRTIEKQPNELVIAFEEADEPELVAALEASDLVRYIVYLAR